MHVAARNGHAEVVRLLLQEGADINTEDEERETALDRAVSRRGEVRAKLGQESPHTKGLEAVVRLLSQSTSQRGREPKYKADSFRKKGFARSILVPRAGIEFTQAKSLRF